MPANIEITVTTAGRAALVNATNTGTAPVTITQVGFSATAVVPSGAAVALAGEFKRIEGVGGAVVAPDTIHINAMDDSADAYTMRSFALYLANGTLFAIYGQADPLIVKTAGSAAGLAIDTIFADINAALLTFGNTNFLNPPATTAQQGVVELATVPEAQAGIDALRALTSAGAKAAVLGWLLSQDGSGSGLDADLLDGQDGSFYSNIPARLGYIPWGPANDGSGSGLDADLLDGQDSGFYTNVAARLGYTPVQQGTGVGQLPNTVKIGWSGGGLKATVDVTDLGTFVFAGSIADVWRSSNDGSGSGLDADLLDGQDGSFYSNIPARLGYTPWGPANDGSGSGLDADLLDGLHASDFVRSVDSGNYGQDGNGYWERRPNGVWEMWGQVYLPYVSNVVSTAITFPRGGFPNQCQWVGGNANGAANPSHHPIVVMSENITKNGCTIVADTGKSDQQIQAGRYVMWRAIGI